MEKNLKYKKEFKVPKRKKSMEKNLKYKKEIKVPKRKVSMEKNLKQYLEVFQEFIHIIQLQINTYIQASVKEQNYSKCF